MQDQQQKLLEEFTAGIVIYSYVDASSNTLRS